MRSVNSGNTFKIVHRLKFFIIPRVCGVTKTRIWLEYGYTVCVDTANRPDRWRVAGYLSEKGYTILALKGEI